MIIKKHLGLAITIMGLLFITLQVSAQNTVVTGKVTEKNGQPIPGVSVSERNRDNRSVNGTVSDGNGNFQIKIVDTNDSLHFSQIGSITVKRAIGNQKVINVTLLDDSRMLEAVVVKAGAPRLNSGGFLEVTEANRTDARTSINMKDLEDIPATTIDQILEGKASGLLISMNSGNPGSGSSIQIRGGSSIGLGSKPLVVVDNVPFKSQATVDLSNPNALSELTSISPSDIATIDILKDAAATALYGSDGANGVILITTKRGSNSKPMISLTSRLTLKTPQQALPLLNGDEYKTMILEGYQNRYGTGTDLTNSAIGKLFLEPSSLDYENYNNNIYWPGAVTMSQSLAQNYDAGIRGGGESAAYNVSLNYIDEAGPLKGTSYKRVSGRFNFDYRLSNKLKFTSDIALADINRNNYYDNNDNTAFITKAPILPVYTQDLYGNSLSTYFMTQSGGFQSEVRNPIALIDQAQYKENSQRLDAKITVQYNPFKGFQFNNLFSTTNESFEVNKFLPHSATGVDYYRQNNVYLRLNNQYNLTSSVPKRAVSVFYQNTMTYRFNLPQKYKLSAGMFTTVETTGTSEIKLEGTNTPSEYLSDPYSTEILNTISSERKLQHKIKNIGQLTFTYDEVFGASGVLTREGNSVFGENNRWGLFPAFSGYFTPSNLSFIKKNTSKWLDFFKFRGSWGVTGRGPNPFDANSYVPTASTFSANAPFVDIQGVTPDNIQLMDLRWERNEILNGGFDMAMFKGKLTFTGDLSRSTTRDLILNNTPIASSSGFELITSNFGTLRNDELNLAIGVAPIKTKTWTVSSSFNITTSQSRVLELPNNQPIIKPNTTLDNGSYLSLLNVGDPIGTFYGLKYLGVYSRDEDAFSKDAQGNFLTDFNGLRIPMRWNNQAGEVFTGGDAKYADMNNDGVINKLDVVALGNSTPRFYGGMTFKVDYKTLSLFATFAYQSDFDIINRAQLETSKMYNANNQSTAVMRRWRKQGDGVGDETDVPRALFGAGHNFVGSDRYVEDGSFIAFRSLSLGYGLPKKVINTLNLKSARLTLAINNLATFTKYTGVDPSISANRNDPFSMGEDKGLTPSPIQYTLGINVNF